MMPSTVFWTKSIKTRSHDSRIRYSFCDPR